jgi:hypothetical protein
MLPAIGRARGLQGSTAIMLRRSSGGAVLLARRALGTTIDITPRGVADGERPIIIVPPAGEEQANSGGNSSAEGEPQQQQQQQEAAAAAGAKGWGLFPDDIVSHLDRFVVGQEDAKKVRVRVVSVWAGFPPGFD